MKNYLVAAGLGLLLFSSCKEVLPPLEEVDKVDTSYITTPEEPQPRNVLVEEYTGVRCVNCPAGTTILEAASAAYPGRLVVVGLHSGAQTDPLPESKFNFASDKAGNLMTYFGENPPKPAASIDRVPKNDIYFVFRPDWTEMINNRMAMPTPVNLAVTSTYNGTNRQAAIKIRVAYTGTVSKKHSLSLFVIENGIVDAQEYPDHVDEEYDHNHVFRDMLTSAAGSVILDNVPVKEAGRVFERTVTYTVNDAWQAANLKIVAVVHNSDGSDKEVIQVAQADIATP